MDNIIKTMKVNPKRFMCGGRVAYSGWVRPSKTKDDMNGGFAEGEGDLANKSRLQTITSRLETLAKKNKQKPKNITF